MKKSSNSGSMINSLNTSKFALLAAVLYFSLCSVVWAAEDVLEYVPGQTLPPEHGYLIMGMHSPNPAVTLRFKSGFKAYATEDFPAGHQYKLLILPEGKYRLEALFVGGLKFTMANASNFHDWAFEIEPGKVNYMGEVLLDGNNIQRWVNGETILKVVNLTYPDLPEDMELVYTGENR